MPESIDAFSTSASSNLAWNCLSRLREITSTINAGGTLSDVLERLLVGVCNGAPWSRGGIMAVNRASGFSERVAVFAPGEQARDQHLMRWPLATSPVPHVAQSRRPLIIADAQCSTEYPGYQADAIARDYNTVVLLPLGCTSAEEHELVLSIHAIRCVEVDAAELDFLTTIAHLVAIAVEKVKHLQHERWQSERLRRVLDAGSHLMEMVLEGAPLKVTAGLVAAIVADPFVILDLVSDTIVVRRSPLPQTVTEREWRALVEGSGAALLAAWTDQTEGTSSEGRLDLASVGLSLTLPVFTEKLRVDGETVGALLIFPGERQLDSLDRVVSQEVGFALSAQIMRHHAEAKREAQDLAALFDQLCRPGAGDPARAASRLGLPTARPARLLAVMPPPLRGEPPVAAMRRLLTTELSCAVPGALVIERARAAAIIWPLPHQDAPLATALLENHVLQPIRARWGAQATIAIGPVCVGAADFQAAWAECARVLHLAHIFKRDGLVRQVDFGSFALLLSALDDAAVLSLVESTLGPIRRHDAEHAGDLAETMTTFIDEACRYQATAQRLGIHVSTLRYRLQRVEELFGLDLEDAETRFRVSLAARLLAIRSAGAVATTWSADCYQRRPGAS